MTSKTPRDIWRPELNFFLRDTATELFNNPQISGCTGKTGTNGVYSYGAANVVHQHVCDALQFVTSTCDTLRQLQNNQADKSPLLSDQCWSQYAVL
jgi:hypothetical protein